MKLFTILNPSVFTITIICKLPEGVENGIDLMEKHVISMFVKIRDYLKGAVAKTKTRNSKEYAFEQCKGR